VGLVAKNGILIVEFANELQREGLSKLMAVREASLTRLRPILMTSVATAVGHFPLTLVTGPGAEARNSIGLVLVMGMVVGTFFTLGPSARAARPSSGAADLEARRRSAALSSASVRSSPRQPTSPVEAISTPSVGSAPGEAREGELRGLAPPRSRGRARAVVHRRARRACGARPRG
jgi:predicted RND superfamily exporter protein